MDRACPLFVFGRAGRVNNRGIDDGALTQRQAFLLQIAVDGFAGSDVVVELKRGAGVVLFVEVELLLRVFPTVLEKRAYGFCAPAVSTSEEFYAG